MADVIYLGDWRCVLLIAFFVLIGIGLIIDGFRALIERFLIKWRCKTRVYAVISEAKARGPASSSKTSYYPVYRYMINDKEYEVTCKAKAYKENEIEVGNYEAYFADSYHPERCYCSADLKDLKGQAVSGITAGIFWFIMPFAYAGWFMIFPNMNTVLSLVLVTVVMFVIWFIVDVILS